jgi:2-oxoglutarate dehydrogenase E2 component (dihydrolipoamide succinyltransferase)
VIELRVPKLNNNDTAYLLVEWIAKDGQAVSEGEPVVVLETSKAAEELPAVQSGILTHALAEGAECAPGDVIARIGTDRPPSTDRRTSVGQIPSAEPAEPEADEVVITQPARAFMDEHGITMEQVRALNLTIVRRSDLEPLAGVAPIRLSPSQRRTAKVVSRSHREIPTAYTAVKIDVTGALEKARSLSRELRILVGLPELIIEALGDLGSRFPLCFAEPIDDESARPAQAVRVGVTMDVGRGLFVPVVRTTHPVQAVAEELARHRRTALSGAFTEHDLSGGSITLTLHPDNGVVLAIPIIFPGQTCSLALTSPAPEVVPLRAGELQVRQRVMLGLAYDHRFVNGRDSAEFLNAIRRSLEA